ncbi:MAG: hypothetical protein UDG86_02605 [Lachnospiraceae bacterium]|jgi:hypothetical protein|nr:hypothetical protein [Lachnospiraceae bacterium]
MDNMFILMDMLVVGCGVYVLYAFYLMKAKGEVKESLLLSNGAKMAKCKDKNAYMAYISPRLLIFGLATIICGGLGVWNDYTNVFGLGYLVVMVIFLAMVVWFAMAIKKSLKMYW